MSISNEFFYHGLMRKYTVAFGSMFNHLYVQKENHDRKFTERVSLSYANKKKFVRRILQDPNLQRRPAIRLPKMAFELTSVEYNPERKISSKRKIAQQTNSGLSYTYNPLPFDFSFSLYLTANTQTECLQIVEQILPYFDPDYTFRMEGVNNPSVSFDVPVSLQSALPDYDFEGDFEQREVIGWTFDFLMKGWIFGPSRDDSQGGGLIKEVITDVNDLETEDNFETVRVEPYIQGVPVSEIEENDDWSISTTIEDTNV